MSGDIDTAPAWSSAGPEGPGSPPNDPGAASRSIAGDSSTTAEVAVGETVDETLETIGDSDWFRIKLAAGESIRIDLTGVDHDPTNAIGALPDPYLRLRDASGAVIALDDDSGAGLNARLSYTVATAGTYFIDADSYQSGYRGDYRLKITAITPPSPVEAVQGHDTLDDSDPILVYFAEAGDTYQYSGATYVATGVNDYEQTQLWSIFEGIERFANIEFRITTDRDAADLEWATAKLPTIAGSTLLGFFLFPNASGDGRYGVLNDDSEAFPYWNSTPGGTLDTGGFMYASAVHELGHGLGLAHPHDRGNGTSIMQGVATYASLGAFDLNSMAYTAMSYNDGSALAGAASITASTGHATGFGALDIAALQAMYGANPAHAAGNDVYLLDHTNAIGSGAGYSTIWDTGGIDQIRFDDGRDVTIDLRAATLVYAEGGGGFLSYVQGVIGGRTIANGVVIENAVSGAGDDVVNGNAAANWLSGGAGDDNVHGFGGRDRLLGRAGDDVLDGGDQNDILLGGAGSDQLSGGAGHDRLKGGAQADKLEGGEGYDLLDYSDSQSGVTVDLATGAVSGGSATGDIISGFERVRGSRYDDRLSGDDGRNVLLGDRGRDRLEGSGGRDRLDGGAGNDLLDYLHSPAGVRVDLATGRGRGGDADGDTLTGFEKLRGSLFDDRLSGDGAGNVLIGSKGHDVISGGGGEDILRGGAGRDRFLFSSDDGSDSIFGGNGRDICDFAGFTSDAFAIVDLAGANWTLTHIASGQTDTLVSIEALLFDDLGLFA